MKIRKSFVSNSSSSSFIIAKSDLNLGQIYLLINHAGVIPQFQEIDPKVGHFYTEWAWQIDMDDNYISGYTSMDNFNMHRFMELIGIDPANVKWDDFWDFDLEGDITAEEEEEDEN